MNKRIRELAEQAGYPDYMTYGQDLVLERFAELIVRECMGIADGQKKYVEDMEVFNEQDANWNRARIQQSQQIVDKIKEHFGVES
jgi:hypothetical protein